MAKFRHVNGGICEVFTKTNINRLRSDKNYVEVPENKSERVIQKEVKLKDTKTKEKQPNKVEEVEDKPLQ